MDGASVSSVDVTAHELRSKKRYTQVDTYIPRHQALHNAFWRVYRDFQAKSPISADARTHLDSFIVSEDEFVKIVVESELADSRFISLEDNKIKFDEHTIPPHGEIITEIQTQIGMQDRAGGSLFIGGTGNRITLSKHNLHEDVTLIPGGSDKAPDGHWQINPHHIPAQLINSFPTNPRTGTLAPCLVLEVAVCNESIPILTQVDLARYFAPGTGTRAWIGVKIFKDHRHNPPNHRWWCGWASRDRAANGTFLDSATINPESMPILHSHNSPLSTQPVPRLSFNIDVAPLIDPMAVPQGYSPTILVDMELVRQLALVLM